MNAFNPSEALPHNIELEQQVLGAVLTNNDRYHEVGAIIGPEHFHDPVHARIWKHIAGRISNDHLASPVTLKSEMEFDEGLAELGGASYLVNLVGASISSFAVRDYALDLVEIAERRRIMSDVRDVMASLRAGSTSQNAISALEVVVSTSQELAPVRRSKSLLAAHTDSLRAMHEAQTSGEAGLSSGLKALDELLLLKPKRTTIVAGATSMGKTSVATWLAYTAAKQGYGVAFVSLEMGEEDLANRINSIDSQVPYRAFDRPMSENLFRQVLDAAKGQENLPIEIMSDRVRDVPAILSEARRLQRHWQPSGAFKGLGLLIVDYLQLVRGRGNAFEVLTQASQAMKSIAKIMNIHVVPLAQISRDMSKRESKIPHLGDLRGSGDLENDADNVIFCHRPAYYLERALQDPPADMGDRADLEASLAACRGTMDLIVAKQRMGPIGQCRVGCDLGTNRFWDIHQQHGMDF